MTPTLPPTDQDGRAGERSQRLLQDAKRVIPGGVNSPVRAFAAVGGEPPFVRKAAGAHLITEDGAAVIDYVGSWGPALFGHAYPTIVEAVQKAARDGLSFGAATAGEVEFAQAICKMVPSLRGGMVRLTSSGTEATMSALRLARGFTGRDVIVKMDGAYHGHADVLLVAAGSGAATLGLPGSAGVPADVVRNTLVLPWNDLEACNNLVRARGHEIAAIIVEPVAGNMGCVPPQPGYLEGLRELCTQAGIVLIFDEVMTGFRLAAGGAQACFGITPDLTCLGKIVGGGLPVGAYGGRRDIMEKVAPLGPVYQAGTLSGNPLAVAAGRAMLHLIEQQPPYEQLEETTARLVDGLLTRARAAGLEVTANRAGSMWTLFFQPGPVRNYDDAKRSDTALFGRFHAAMLSHGVFLPPSQFEACFVSAAHTAEIIDATLEAAEAAFLTVATAKASSGPA